MKFFKTALVFALGFLCASIFQREGSVHAQGANTNCQPQIDQATLNALKQRLSRLEKLGCAALGKSRVVAPFRVVDRQDPNNTIFEVKQDPGANVATLYSGQAAVAEVEAREDGGLMVARGKENTVYFGIGALVTGFGVTGIATPQGSEDKKNMTRILLGKQVLKKDYALKFFTSSGADLAGIGESSDTHAGLAFINDASGSRKAVIAVGKDGKGSMEVVNADKTVAQLTESVHRGGKLVICSASQCDPPMVAAGDVGGYGLVAAGPLYFNTGGGLIGGNANPGSFIKGKQ